jgi:hypothetical protein
MFLLLIHVKDLTFYLGMIGKIEGSEEEEEEKRLMKI